MTHIKNIPYILEKGIVHKNSINASMNYVSIGDTSLINTRNNKKIIIGNKTITLGDYIPFYFGVRMPMLYVIQKGGNCVPQATRPEDIIYVVISLKSFLESGQNFYFSDGHGTDALSIFYDKTAINQLPNIINWESVLATKWDETSVKRQKQAEFLVEGDVNTKHIAGYVCYNDNSKSNIIKLGIKPDTVKVFPQAYY